MRYLYDGHIFDLKTRVDLWLIMNAVPVEYGTLSQMFDLIIWLFQSVTDISFRWSAVKWYMVDIFV